MMTKKRITKKEYLAAAETVLSEGLAIGSIRDMLTGKMCLIGHLAVARLGKEKVIQDVVSGCQASYDAVNTGFLWTELYGFNDDRSGPAKPEEIALFLCFGAAGAFKDIDCDHPNQ